MTGVAAREEHDSELDVVVVAALAGLVRLIKIITCKTRRINSNTSIPIDASVMETIIKSRNLATHRRDTGLGS